MEPPFRPSRPSLVAAGLGAAWGFLGYAVLWGHTPLFPSRSFVVGPLGTVVLAPVRLVLWSIHVVEDRFASAPFDFSTNNGWIGILAAVAGAAMTWLGFVMVRAFVRRARPYVATSRRSNHTSPTAEKITTSATSTTTSPGASPPRSTS